MVFAMVFDNYIYYQANSTKIVPIIRNISETAY